MAITPPADNAVLIVAIPPLADLSPPASPASLAPGRTLLVSLPQNSALSPAMSFVIPGGALLQLAIAPLGGVATAPDAAAASRADVVARPDFGTLSEWLPSNAIAATEASEGEISSIVSWSRWWKAIMAVRWTLPMTTREAAVAPRAISDNPSSTPIADQNNPPENQEATLTSVSPKEPTARSSPIDLANLLLATLAANGAMLAERRKKRAALAAPGPSLKTKTKSPDDQEAGESP
ncbi:MAG: hypothetical protein WCL32_26385 [Planctomycetota bacterium]